MSISALFTTKRVIGLCRSGSGLTNSIGRRIVGGGRALGLSVPGGKNMIVAQGWVIGVKVVVEGGVLFSMLKKLVSPVLVTRGPVMRAYCAASPTPVIRSNELCICAKRSRSGTSFF